MGKIETKFKLGEQVALINPLYGQDPTFTIGMVHITCDQFGRSNPIYSHGFYDYGYPEDRLTYFISGHDINGDLIVIPYTKKYRWKKFKAVCRRACSKLKFWKGL